MKPIQLVFVTMIEDNSLPYRRSIRQEIIATRLSNSISSQVRDDQDPLVNPEHIDCQTAEVMPLAKEMAINLGDIKLHPEYWIKALLGSKAVEDNPEIFRLGLLLHETENGESRLRHTTADLSKDQADLILNESLTLYGVNYGEFWREVKHAWNSHVADSNGKADIQPPFISRLLAKPPTSG